MKNLFTFSLLFLSTLLARSQSPELIIDLDGSSSSSIQPLENGIVEFNGQLFFNGGGELWTTDGTEAGTSLLKDIFPGPNGTSGCQNFYEVNGMLLFTANDGTNGKELWRTDGTGAGTMMVKDIKPGSGDGIPNSINQNDQFYVWNNVLYFTADDEDSGNELWRSDGTADGTFLFFDFNPNGGLGSFAFPSYFTEYDGRLYFVTAGPTGHGIEVWVTDGMAGGTMELKDIESGFFGSDPRDLVSCNGYLLFTADVFGQGRELWRSDGTEEGTELVKEIRAGALGGLNNNSFVAERKLVKVGDIVYFAANNGSDGDELWQSDGSDAGTFMIKNATAGNGGYAPRNFAVLNNLLLYEYDDGEHGRELWRSDGTDAGTFIVKDLAAGSGNSFSFMSRAFSFNGKAFFTLDDNIGIGTELWQSNGSESSISLIADIHPVGNGAPFQFIGFQDFLVFAADHPDFGKELWRLLVETVAPLSSSVAINNGIDCNGEATGALEVSAVGGVEPYTYNWSPNNLQGANPTALGAGTYTVTVADADGNEVVLDIEITEPSELTAIFTTEPEMNGADGSATVEAGGGTPPYTYLWDTAPPATSPTITGLNAGTYSVTITDSNDCTSVESVVVDLVEGTEESLSELIEITPTLVNGSFTILSQTPLFGMEVSLTDLTGRRVRTWKDVGSGQRLNVSDISANVYVLIIEWNERTSVSKLLVQGGY